MPAHLQPEAAPCGPGGSADLASEAPLRRTGWPARRNVARTLTAIGLAQTLSACSIPRMIDSQVQSFVGTAGAEQSATYRFERLPSQQSQPEIQERVEAMAKVALQRVGLTLATPADSQARYSIQVEVQVAQFQPPPRRSTHLIAPFVNADGSPAYSPLLFLSEPPWYIHTAHLVMRDTQNGQVAYETSGRFEGPWSDSATLWPVVLESALQGYPHPPQGVRTVTIELPRKGARHD